MGRGKTPPRGGGAKKGGGKGGKGGERDVARGGIAKRGKKEGGGKGKGRKADSDFYAGLTETSAAPPSGFYHSVADPDGNDSDGDGSDIELGDFSIDMSGFGAKAKRAASAAADEGSAPSGSDEDEEDAGSSSSEEGLDIDEESEDELADEGETFQDLRLPPHLLRACLRLNWRYPTEVQRATIPAATAGRDLCVSAVTGSGKTGAYGLPIVQRLAKLPPNASAAIRAIVLTPTRELAAQAGDMLRKMASACPSLRIAVAAGGANIHQESASLRADIPDILAATPGRLIDHVRNTQGFSLGAVQMLVVDEADRLLELGFADELDELIRHLPDSRQTLFFSATMTTDVEALARVALRKPVTVAIGGLDAKVPTRLRQEFVRISHETMAERDAALLHLLDTTVNKRTVIFCKTRETVLTVGALLRVAGHSVLELRGNLTQRMRNENLDAFAKGDIPILVATDLAARGIDVLNVEAVINYEMPRTLTVYLHRVGRTARAERRGRALSLVADSEVGLLREIATTLDGKAELLQRKLPEAALGAARVRRAALSEALAEEVASTRVDAQLTAAEGEVTRAQNLLLHADEIAARPRRTWFQSEKDKKALKVADREAVKKGEDVVRMATVVKERALTAAKNKAMSKLSKRKKKKASVRATAPKSRQIGKAGKRNFNRTQRY